VHHQPVQPSLARRHSLAFIAVGVFLFFGALMALLAAITLMLPGTLLDEIWRLNPYAYSEMKPYGKIIGMPLALLSCALAASGYGWFRRRVWAWRLAVSLIAIQVLANFINLFLGRILEGSTGLVLAGALLLYLLRRRTRDIFP
jgi:hypothetical protein